MNNNDFKETTADPYVTPVKEKSKMTKGKKAFIIVFVVLYTVAVSLASSILTKVVLDYKANKIAEEKAAELREEATTGSNSVSAVLDGDDEEEEETSDIEDEREETTKNNIIPDSDRIEVVPTHSFASGDVFEMSLDSAEWSEKVLPSDTSGYYNYYDDKAGEKYLIIRGKVKNISSKPFSINNVSDVTMFVNDSYESSSVYLTCEDADGKGFSSEIKALQTLDVIIYASFSDEVYEVGNEVRVELDFLADSSELVDLFYLKDDMEKSKIVTNFKITK